MKINRFLKPLLVVAWLLSAGAGTYANGNFGDTTRAYTIPLLVKTPKGDVALSWTEKDNEGIVYLYWAESKDKGKTFGDKKLIFSSPGIGNGRLMRPKLLFKKDGSLVAVFSLRGSEAATPQLTNAAKATPQEPAHAHEHGTMQHADGQAKSGPQKNAPQGGGRPRDSKIVYCLSKDQGDSWTKPVPVHTDNTPNIVRGFFDAIVLANGEVGVAYLNDIEGKAHQRDLRFVSSKGDRFGAERILDPFVCDCCNISLLVDNSGTLQMYYRENQDNIRDIAKMSSKDNGLTFSKPKSSSTTTGKSTDARTLVPHQVPATETL